MTFKNTLSNFVGFIFVVKILLIITGVYTIISSETNIQNNSFLDFIEILHQKIEFLFKICIAILLLTIFHPTNPRLNEITKELTLILFTYGILIIFESDWSNIFAYTPKAHKIKKFIKASNKTKN